MESISIQEIAYILAGVVFGYVLHGIFRKRPKVKKDPPNKDTEREIDTQRR